MLPGFETAYLTRLYSVGYMQDQFAKQLDRVRAFLLRCYPHEWTVLIENPFQPAQQGAPAGTDGGAAAAAEGSRRSRAAELTFKMPGTSEDVGAVVQALLHRTPTTSPPWPVRCLCFSRTVGTSRQLNVRAWCPDENCDSAHLHRVATSRGCSRRRRGSCSPRWPTRDWRRYATHARPSNMPWKGAAS